MLALIVFICAHVIKFQQYETTFFCRFTIMAARQLYNINVFYRPFHFMRHGEKMTFIVCAFAASRRWYVACQGYGF